jgi:hypothetical protein
MVANTPILEYVYIDVFFMGDKRLTKIRDCLYELQGIAYLIERQHPECAEESDAYYGLGLALQRPIRQAMRLIDDLDLNAASANPERPRGK